MNSSRLPGKVMMDLCGKTVLSHVVERVKTCKAVEQIVVATTELASDQKIVGETLNLGVDLFRGSEDDVLSRYYNAAKVFGAETIIRVTADCPLFDPEILSRMLYKTIQ